MLSEPWVALRPASQRDPQTAGDIGGENVLFSLLQYPIVSCQNVAAEVHAITPADEHAAAAVQTPQGSSRRAM